MCLHHPQFKFECRFYRREIELHRNVVIVHRARGMRASRCHDSYFYHERVHTTQHQPFRILLKRLCKNGFSERRSTSIPPLPSACLIFCRSVHVRRCLARSLSFEHGHMMDMTRDKENHQRTSFHISKRADSHQNETCQCNVREFDHAEFKRCQLLSNLL